MDTKLAPVNKPLWRKYWYVLPIALLLVGTYALKNMLGNASYIVQKNTLVTATVTQGNFRVNVRASGVLKPADIRWVSSQVGGRVEQVFVKAGAQVTKGQLLVQLSNAELHRELEKARWELEATTAESHAAYVVLESQLLDLDNAVVEANYSYQSVKLKLDAETLLKQQGNATVSALDYQRSQLAVKQQRQLWQSQQQKAQKMQENLMASRTAQQARLGLVENNYQRIKDQVEALSVKATTDGVVQQVSLLLGAWANIGDSVALIADQQALFAELQVEEVKVRDIMLGQKVELDTRTSKLYGSISRIDPAVSAGMVMVDVQLSGDLPAEARPDLTVDGLIEVSNIDNALYVKRPVFASRYSVAGLYKLSSDQQFAVRQTVDLGQSSVNEIQIVSGLVAGDKIIISDTSNWQEHHQIMIN